MNRSVVSFRWNFRHKVLMNRFPAFEDALRSMAVVWFVLDFGYAFRVSNSFGYS